MDGHAHDGKCRNLPQISTFNTHRVSIKSVQNGCLNAPLNILR